MRRKLKRLGEFLQEHTISNITSAILAILGTGAIVINLNIDLDNITLKVPAIMVVVVVGYIAYLIFSFFLNDFVHSLGNWFIKSSKWYPEWLYRPKFDYRLGIGMDKVLTLYIKSLPGNQDAHLRLDFVRARLKTGTDEEKYATDVSSGNHKNLLYNKEIVSNAEMVVPISGKSNDGRDVLSFQGDMLAILLFHGKYSYEFYESGTYKGVGFGRKTIKLEFVYNENGEFEIIK